MKKLLILVLVLQGCTAQPRWEDAVNIADFGPAQGTNSLFDSVTTDEIVLDIVNADAFLNRQSAGTIGIGSTSGGTDGTLAVKSVVQAVSANGMLIAGQSCELWGGMQPQPSSVGVAGTGIFSEGGHAESDDTSGFAMSVDGAYFWQKTAATAGNDAGIINYNGTEIYTTQANPIYVYKFALPETADFNAVFGLSSGSISVTTLSANPAAETIMLRFYAGTDTNFIYYTSTDATNFTETDSGVAKDTAVHYLVVDVSGDGTTVDFSLYDRTFTQEGVTKTVTTNLPAATTTMAMMGVIQANVATAKEIRHYWWRCGMRPD